MKKVSLLFFTIILTLAFGGAASAAAPQTPTPTVYIDGKKLDFADQPPVIQNGRTLVPMRAIFEALGAEVKWDQVTQTVTAFRPDETYAGFLGDKTITLTIGKNTAHLVSDVRERPENSRDEDIALDVPAQVMNSRTMVPLRFVSETLDAHVKWDAKTNRIDIYTPQVKEYWYQYDPIFGRGLIQRYDLWTYEEPEELEFHIEQTYLRTIKYGDSSNLEFYAFFVNRTDPRRYGLPIMRNEMEARGTVTDKYWNITFDLFGLDDETRELISYESGKHQVPVVYDENGRPIYDQIPFYIAIAFVLLDARQ